MRHWDVKTVVYMLLVCLLAACHRPVGEKTFTVGTREVKVSPSAQTNYITGLVGQDNAQVILNVPVLDKIEKPIDVVLVLDRTGSMSSAIDSARDAARMMVSEVARIAPQAQFAVAAVADDPAFSPSEPDIQSYVLLQPLTRSEIAIESALASITLADGGDADEAYNTGLLHASRIPWRGGSERYVILIADSEPHGADAGADGVVGTADDVTLPQSVSALQGANAKLIVLHIGGSSALLAQAAQATGGALRRLDDARSTGAGIKTELLKRLMPVQKITPEGLAEKWVRSIEVVDQTSDGKYTYNVDLKVPQGSPGGRHVIPLRATVSIAGTTGNASVAVNAITGWINDPALPFLPLALLLLAAISLTVLALLFGNMIRRFSVFNRRTPWTERLPPWIDGAVSAVGVTALILASIGLINLFLPKFLPSDLVETIHHYLS